MTLISYIFVEGQRPHIQQPKEVSVWLLFVPRAPDRYPRGAGISPHPQVCSRSSITSSNSWGAPAFGSGQWSNSYPADLYETGDNVVLEMAVPGVQVQDLDVSIEGRQLTISGTFPNFSENEERRYWLQTIPRGQFSRTVSLPAGVDVDSVDARVHEGLLTLTLPKAVSARSRKIEITNG
jgi:HSP20 family protein